MYYPNNIKNLRREREREREKNEINYKFIIVNPLVQHPLQPCVAENGGDESKVMLFYHDLSKI